MRILCYARGTFREKFMNKMIDLSGGDLSLGCHLGYEAADYHGVSLQMLNSKVGRAGSVITPGRLASSSLSALVGDSCD